MNEVSTHVEKMEVTPHESYLLSNEVRAAEELYAEAPGYEASCLVQKARRDRDAAVSHLRGMMRIV